jgi:hypothetical protein
MKSKSKLLDNSTKIEVLRLRNDDYSVRAIASILGIGKTSISDFLSGRSYKEFWDEMGDKDIAAGSIHDHHYDIEEAKGNRFILTSAQNNSFIHEKFVQSLEVMSARLEAEILIGTYIYNTNGFQSPNVEKDEVWFDNKIKKYIKDEPVKLAEGLMWYGELNILPTAVNPLSGLDSYTKTNSGIVPHAKVQLESLATHKAEPCRMMYTTGTVTQRNYIQKKAGQKASFHHVFGALLVEVDDDGEWYVRQLVANSDTGEFYDLDTLYNPTGYSTGHRVEAITYGDIHIEKQHTDVMDGAFHRKDSMMNELHPRYQFLHDVSDFSARNHHNINDPHHKFKYHVAGKSSVEEETKEAADFLGRIEIEDTMNVVVQSNHHQAYERWLKEGDYKNDPENAVFFLTLQLATYEAIERGEYDFNVYEYAVILFESLPRTLFLKEDEPFKVCGDIECGCHGHRGISGSRGSINAFRKMGGRYNVDHSHGCGIKDGAYQGGVLSDLDLGYNVGASNWSASSIVVYQNGKRAIITQSQNTGNWKALN